MVSSSDAEDDDNTQTACEWQIKHKCQSLWTYLDVELEHAVLAGRL